MDLNLNVSAVDNRASASRAVGSGAVAGQVAKSVGASSVAGNTVVGNPVVGNTQASGQTLEEAVGSLQDLMASKHQNLDFSVDEETGIQVVKVVARDTGEVIRQLPSEVVLKLAQAASEGNTSLFDGWA